MPSTDSLRAVIFDFGGVLMRTSDPVGRREWEDRLGLPKGELERVVHGSGAWIKAQRGELSYEAYWEKVAENINLPLDLVPQLRADYFRDDHLDPVLIALLRHLRSRGFLVGLLSNDVAALEHKLRVELGIYDDFDAVVISAKIGYMKPDTEAYQAICTALSVEPAQAVFIDDNPDNVFGAEQFGLKAIRYRSGMDVEQALQPFIEPSASNG